MGSTPAPGKTAKRLRNTLSGESEKKRPRQIGRSRPPPIGALWLEEARGRLFPSRHPLSIGVRQGRRTIIRHIPTFTFDSGS